jgi:peptidoglycan/LPS O-acetylase OafA/YrhL
MELIAAVLIAGPLGYFVRPRGRALVAYLGIWAVIFPIQTIVVVPKEASDPTYWILNAVILAAGIGLNRLGAVFGERRRESSASAEAVS